MEHLCEKVKRTADTMYPPNEPRPDHLDRRSEIRVKRDLAERFFAGYPPERAASSVAYQYAATEPNGTIGRWIAAYRELLGALAERLYREYRAAPPSHKQIAYLRDFGGYGGPIESKLHAGMMIAALRRRKGAAR